MIPKEVWDLKQEWDYLGKDISSFQDGFLNALGKKDGWEHFGEKGMELMQALNDLHLRSGVYIREYNAERGIK
jgi:hypothetical protein